MVSTRNSIIAFHRKNNAFERYFKNKFKFCNRYNPTLS